MDSEVIEAWISDQHVLIHACANPLECRLPLDYLVIQPDHQVVAAKRRRVPLADVDTNPTRMPPKPDETDLRRSPRRKHHGNRPGHQQDPAIPDHAVADTDAPGSDVQTMPPLLYNPGLPRHRSIVPIPLTYRAKLGGSNRQLSASGSRDPSSRTSGRTRSTSPVKNPDDLVKLEKPVSWTSPDPRALRDMVKSTGSAEGLRLFDHVWSVIQGEGYLPRELMGLLKEELMVGDSRFAPRPRDMIVSQADKDLVRQLFPLLLGDEDDQACKLLALRDELNAIRDIVATTIRFNNVTRSEAAWNEHIHGPMLSLAVSSIPHVAAENITQATIARSFIPAARGELETLGGKMIDYALLLRPDKHLAVRIVDFVDGFDGPQTFNQSTYGPLCYEPTGVLIETKVDTRRCAEAKAQLGIWLAAWYGRVASFAPLPSDGDTEMAMKLPFLPVLLVVCQNWELHFAFDKGDEFEVCGPLEIGSTVTVDGSYRLLAVLRLLAGWVASDFRRWVERCLD